MTTRQVAPSEPLEFRGGWLILARAAWIVLVGAPVIALIMAIPIYFEQVRSMTGAALLTGFAESWTTDGLLMALADVGLPPWGYQVLVVINDMLVVTVFLTAALVLFIRSGREWIGWYTSLMLALLGIITSNTLTVYSMASPLVHTMLASAGWLTFYIFLFIFPDGRVQPRWMRIIVAAILCMPLIPILSPDFMRTNSLAGPLILLLFGAGGYSQIYRYMRVSNTVERLQTRWLITSIITLGSLILLLGFVAPAVIPGAEEPGRVKLILRMLQLVIFPLALIAVPVAIGIAILRYKLWNIDIIIRRTLIYGIITLLLAAVYYGTVVLLQAAFVRLTGQDSPITVVASTLLIAALFSPVRRRVQRFIDRRFYRRKYDMARTLDTFSASLYKEVDIEHLSVSLMAVVDKSMRPTQISLWVHDPNIEQTT